MSGCPECGGEQMVGHPAGLLAIRHSNGCTLRAAEDATHVADRHWTRRGQFTRPATAAERRLLTALGYTIPTELTTIVTPITASVLRRTWPTITEETAA